MILLELVVGTSWKWQVKNQSSQFLAFSDVSNTWFWQLHKCFIKLWHISPWAQQHHVQFTNFQWLIQYHHTIITLINKPLSISQYAIWPHQLSLLLHPINLFPTGDFLHQNQFIKDILSSAPECSIIWDSGWCIAPFLFKIRLSTATCFTHNIKLYHFDIDLEQ